MQYFKYYQMLSIVCTLFVQCVPSGIEKLIISFVFRKDQELTAVSI